MTAVQAVAEKLEPVQDVTPRRFEMPDLARDGGWVLARLLKVYNHLNEQQMAGWLRGIIYHNEFLFLWLPNAVALAQVERGHTLSPRPLVREHFVWANDPQNPRHVAQAAQMYERIREWARQQNASVMIVGEQTDVSADVIGQLFGKVLERRQKFVRV